MTEFTDEKQWYLANFDKLNKSRNEKLWSAILATRKAAISRFVEMGFPTIRQEAWRFTDIAPITKIPFVPAALNPVDILRPDGMADNMLKDRIRIRLVFVNGRLSSELSSNIITNGIQISSLTDAFHIYPDLVTRHIARYAGFQENPFTALNTAFFMDGGFVYIPGGKIINEPIHFLHITGSNGEPAVSHPRNLIIAGANSQATIIESYLGSGDSTYLCNPVTEIVLDNNAVLEYYKIQQENPDSFHIAVNQVYQGRGSRFTSHAFSFGAAIERNDLNTILDGAGIETILNGLYVTSGRQLVDNHTHIEHAQPHSTSHELYKGILKERSRAVFNGKIHVRQNAQKTDAIQSNQNLLLSDDATVNTQPQLEIFADDVKCTHGGTVGQIDENGIFYLRARGIDATKARNIMIYAFATEVTEQVKVDAVKDHVNGLLQVQLGEMIKVDE